MNTEGMTSDERLEYWEMVKEDFESSNKTKAEYCKGNEIALSTFNYWIGRLKEVKQTTDFSGDRFVEIPPAISKNYSVSPRDTSRSVFIPEMEIACDGLHILINSSTPMALLSSVMRELHHA